MTPIAKSTKEEKAKIINMALIFFDDVMKFQNLEQGLVFIFCKQAPNGLRYRRVGIGAVLLRSLTQMLELNSSILRH
jgi:hypothetical protein